jgi:predicted transcriptional regulator
LAAPTTILKIRLPRELAAELQRLAEQGGRSKSDYARQAIAEFLKFRADNFRAIAALEREKFQQP